MTRRQIHEIALRKRPQNREAYEHVHLALAEELQRETPYKSIIWRKRRYDGPHPITWYFLCLGFLLVWWLA